MLSFRYHLVSIVAVFLALAIGILVGTSVVNQGVIDDLRRRTDAAVQRADELRAEVGLLQADMSSWAAFGAEVEPLLVRGTLEGRTVVVVTMEGVDVGHVDGVRRILAESGATVAGILVATPRMALEEDEARRELAAMMGGVPDEAPEVVTAEAASRLGTRLAVGGGNDPDFLEQLIVGEYLALRSGSRVAAEIGGRDHAVVLVSGGEVEPAVQPEVFLTPIATSLATIVRPVVAAETATTVYPFVPLIREDAQLDRELVTVDNADTMPGRVALVLGLRDLFDSGRTGADYGVKEGAARLLPAE